eukprot:1191297-Prorocentrum_minimum.AAC.2
MRLTVPDCASMRHNTSQRVTTLPHLVAELFADGVELGGDLRNFPPEAGDDEGEGAVAEVAKVGQQLAVVLGAQVVPQKLGVRAFGAVHQQRFRRRRLEGTTFTRLLDVYDASTNPLEHAYYYSAVLFLQSSQTLSLVSVQLVFIYFRRFGFAHLRGDIGLLAVVAEDADAAALGELRVLVVEILGGADLAHERPGLPGGDEAGGEDHRVEGHVVLAHELHQLHVLALPPLLPVVRVRGGDGDVADGRIEPHVQHLPRSYSHAVTQSHSLCTRR